MRACASCSVGIDSIKTGLTHKVTLMVSHLTKLNYSVSSFRALTRNQPKLEETVSTNTPNLNL